MTTYRIFQRYAPDFMEHEVKNNSGFPVELISFDDAVFIINLLRLQFRYDEFVIVDSHGTRSAIM